MSDKYICVIAALIALCYCVYILGFISIGEQPADGVLFSACIGGIALVAGVQLRDRFGE